MTDSFDALQTALNLQQSGAHAKAIDVLRGVLQEDPLHPDGLHLLGLSLQELGESDAALAEIEKAIAVRPSVAMFQNSAGAVSVARGDLSKGIEYYRRALELDPESSSACNNLGIALQKLGYFDQALIAYSHALEIEPEMISAIVNLGNVLSDLGREAEAIEQYGRALALAPSMAEIHNNLGNAFKAQSKFAEAIESYDQALAIRPDYADAYFNRGGTLARRGDIDSAKESLERAIAIRPDPRYRLTLAGLMPVIPASRDEIEKWRKHFGSSISALYAEGHDETGLIVGGSVMDFYLAYHGEDDRDILVLLARLFRRMFPDLAWETPHRFPRPGRNGSRHIRLGFFSTFLRNHAVAWTIRGLIEQVPKDRFDITVYTTHSSLGPVMPEIGAVADRVVTLPKSLERARKIIADDRLDVLVFADIGMENLSSGIAHARLAPVQCATWGHPVTTGIPTIDYFISNDIAEPEGAEALYSEQLVRLGGVQTCYRRPDIPERGELAPLPNVPEGSTIYLCPQSLFKIHPDMDRWLLEILRRDPLGVLVLFAGLDDFVTDLMSSRLRHQFGPDMDRVIILPRTTVERFIEIMVLSDVVLDTWPFGSGNTSYQAFAAGRPVVTFPGHYLRGRGVLAHYRHMNFLDCVADSPEAYADIAVRLGTDPEFHQRITQMIRDRSHVLFDDEQSSEDFVKFLIEVAT